MRNLFVTCHRTYIPNFKSTEPNFGTMKFGGKISLRWRVVVKFEEMTVVFDFEYSIHTKFQHDWSIFMNKMPRVFKICPDFIL